MTITATSEIEENYMLLMEADERLQRNEGKNPLSFNEVLTNLGITEQDLSETEDIDIE